MSHLAQHRELLSSLAARGHTIHDAVRDVGRAGIVFMGLPINCWPVPLNLDRPFTVYAPTISMAHILSNSGFANSDEISLRVAAWRNLFSTIQPDLMLADYSPTALISARGRGIRTLATGSGFCVPPDRSPFPAFVTLVDLAKIEQRATDEDRVVSISIPHLSGTNSRRSRGLRTCFMRPMPAC